MGNERHPFRRVLHRGQLVEQPTAPQLVNHLAWLEMREIWATRRRPQAP